MPAAYNNNTLCIQIVPPNYLLIFIPHKRNINLIKQPDSQFAQMTRRWVSSPGRWRGIGGQERGKRLLMNYRSVLISFRGVTGAEMSRASWNHTFPCIYQGPGTWHFNNVIKSSRKVFPLKYSRDIVIFESPMSPLTKQLYLKYITSLNGGFSLMLGRLRWFFLEKNCLRGRGRRGFNLWGLVRMKVF